MTCLRGAILVGVLFTHGMRLLKTRVEELPYINVHPLLCNYACLWTLVLSYTLTHYEPL